MKYGSWFGPTQELGPKLKLFSLPVQALFLVNKKDWDQTESSMWNLQLMEFGSILVARMLATKSIHIGFFLQDLFYQHPLLLLCLLKKKKKLTDAAT